MTNTCNTWLKKPSVWTAMLGQLVLAAVGSAIAAPAMPEQLPAISDRELETIRGGYALAPGLEISFGIEQAVFIDGILQAVTHYNSASPLVSISIPSAGTKHSETLWPTWEQLPPGNLAPSDLDSAFARNHLFTLVQNNQDNRVIDTVTKLDVAVSGLALLRDHRTLSSLQGQLIDTLR